MKRRFHWSLLSGFLLVLAGMLTFPFFAQFPQTRAFAWPNLLLLLAGVILLMIGFTRSIRQPHLFRGRILGGILATVSLLALGFFLVGIFYFGHVPEPAVAQQTGKKAPELSLPDQDNNNLSLAGILGSPQSRGALLIFYRGHW